jgi:peroxiredoxin Q/BCP
MLEIGDSVPDVTLPADDGSEVSLDDYAGRRLVLYFYPRDDTKGCTTQACDLRDNIALFNDLDVAVVGVSPDSVASHSKFRDKYDLNFPLLADEAHELAEAFGVWKEKSMYGRTYMGIERSTFVIDEAGVIVQAWRRVRPKTHVEKLRTYLEAGD